MKPTLLNGNDSTVLDTLERASKPLSAYDILNRARFGGLKAPVQVYRSLQKLERQGLAHRIEALNAFVACSEHDETCGEGEHRHPEHRPGFVICRECGNVREFEDARVAEVALAAAGEHFGIDLVSLEIYGRCGACRRAA